MAENEQNNIEKTIEKFVFSFLKNEDLEKKPWFRFLKVSHIILLVLVVIAAISILFFLYNDKVLINANVLCKDGTKWGALENGFLLSSYRLCGICTLRAEDESRYETCSLYTDYDYRIVDKKYKHNNSFIEIVGYPIILLISGLGILKIIAIGIVYIISGSKKV